MALIKCKECGKEISNTAEACPYCGYGSVVPRRRHKSKILAGLFCLFLGWFGVHELYLGNIWKAILWLLSSIVIFVVFFLFYNWAIILFLAPFIQAIRLFIMSDSKFDSKYNNTNYPSSKLGCFIGSIIFIFVFFIGGLAVILSIILYAEKMYSEDVLLLTREIAASQQTYYSKTSNYSSTFDKLDIKDLSKKRKVFASAAPSVDYRGFVITLKNDGQKSYVDAERYNKEYFMYLIRKYYKDGEERCIPQDENPFGVWGCYSLGFRE